MPETTWIIPAGDTDSSTPAAIDAVSTPTAQVDHVARALERLPEQFKTSDLIALTTILVTACGDIENALFQLLTERGIYTGVGDTLDVIGKTVGQPRAGQDDDLYRVYLSARIATNRSHGRVEDLIRIARLILDDDTARIVVETQAIATVVVRIEDTTITAEIAETLATFLRAAVKAGVRFILEYDPQGTARWSTQGLWGTGTWSGSF